MRVFIIGASGLIGGNCLKYLSAQGHTCVGSYFSYAIEGLVYFNTIDLAHPDNFDLQQFNPEVIIHCGALTHVDYCETHETESYNQTVLSTQHLIEITQKLQAKLIYLSTDYVFDGLEGPYLEDDQIHPISMYGRHKAEAEQRIRTAGIPHLILRVTNVYGDEIRGKNFVARILEQIQSNQHLTLRLPVDQYATPIQALDIAKAIRLLLRDSKSGTYHLASTDYMNRVQLALRILRYFPQASYDLFPLETVALKQAARRPLQGGLKTHKFLQEYRDFVFSTVDDYLRDKI